MPNHILRSLIDMADSIEEAATVAENRVRDGAHMSRFVDDAGRLCSHIRCEVVEMAKESPLYKPLAVLTSPLTAARILSEVDVSKSDRVGNLFTYAGLMNGKSSGACNERLSHDMHGIVSECLMESPYRRIYDASLKFNVEKGIPEQADAVARRDMLKVFVAHMWNYGRLALGLPVTEPKPGAVWYDISEFGWNNREK